MPIICAKSLREYPWIIDPSKPHERGEIQTIPIDYPCDCSPVEIAEAELDRLQLAAWERVVKD